MLCLKRKDGQWTYVEHRPGDLLAFRLYNFGLTFSGQPTVHLAFEDPARNFEISRPESAACPPVADALFDAGKRRGVPQIVPYPLCLVPGPRGKERAKDAFGQTWEHADATYLAEWLASYAERARMVIPACA